MGKSKPTKKKRGAPPTIKTTQKELVLELVATTSSGLKKICQENKGKVPAYSTVRKLLTKDRQFIDSYARAKEEQADILADEMIEIADNCTDDVTLIMVGEPGEREVINHSAINRAKLQIETRKWIASKLKPKKYGTTAVDLNHSGHITTITSEPLSPDKIKEIAKSLEDGY